MTTPKNWTNKCLQGEQLPMWEVYPTDANGDEITDYDVKFVFKTSQKATANALELYPTAGMVKDGARSYVDYKLANDFPVKTYVVEARLILGNGKVYKTNPFLFEVNQSFNNG